MDNGRVQACVLFLLAAVSIGANSAAAQGKPLTARDVIAQIRAHVGVPWQQETVDTFKAGNPDTEVKGIAVTMMATLDVLQRAAAAGTGRNRSGNGTRAGLGKVSGFQQPIPVCGPRNGFRTLSR